MVSALRGRGRLRRRRQGYESSKGEFVIVDEEEIKALRPETTHVIEIVQVADAREIGPTSIERIYYLSPENKAAGSPFAVVREALGEWAGIGSIALHGRDYVVAVVAQGDAMAMYTLRTAGEVHDVHDISEVVFADVKVKPEEVKLARAVLGSFERLTDVSTLTDRYQESLKKMIAARASEAIDAKPAAGKKGTAPVLNLMEALRRSLAQVKDQKRPTRTPAKKAKVIAHTPGRRRKVS